MIRRSSQRLAYSNNTIHRDINGGCVTRSVTQQIDVGSAQLFYFSKSWNPAVILQLLFPVRLLRYPVGHGRLDESWRYGIDADVVLCPFHGKGMDHVSYAGLGGAIWGGWYALSELERWKERLVRRFRTLFGRYEAMEAVHTMEPFTPSLMKALAATRAE